MFCDDACFAIGMSKIKPPTIASVTKHFSGILVSDILEIIGGIRLRYKNYWRDLRNKRFPAVWVKSCFSLDGRDCFCILA